jgi:hypothetical protein
MDDSIYALERRVHRIDVADIALHKRHILEMRRRIVAVHLVLEAIENDDLVSFSDETLDQVGADEAGTARYQCSHSLTFMVSWTNRSLLRWEASASASPHSARRRRRKPLVT